MKRRAVTFAHYNASLEHQRMAGLASWAAFSARWRARQGLPLLSPLDVQYLTPQDFCNGRGQPLDAATGRRVFRHYVQAALEQLATAPAAPVRQALPVSGDLAFVRSASFGRSYRLRHDYLYGGRDDIPPYDERALRPTRPYGIPVAAVVQGYWLDPAAVPDELEEDGYLGG